MKQTKLKPWNEVLGVQPNCSFEELKQAYRSLAKKYHPDRLPGNDQMMAAIIEAYKIGLVQINVPKETREVEKAIIVGYYVGRSLRIGCAFIFSVLKAWLEPTPGFQVPKQPDYPIHQTFEKNKGYEQQSIIINIGAGHQVNINQ